MVDYGRKRLQWSDSSWTRARQKDSQGHYLLDLLEDPHDLRRKIRDPDFVYVPIEEQDAGHALEVGDATGQPEEEHPDDNVKMKELSGHQTRTLAAAAGQEEVYLNKLLKLSRRLPARRRSVGKFSPDGDGCRTNSESSALKRNSLVDRANGI